MTNCIRDIYVLRYEESVWLAKLGMGVAFCKSKWDIEIRLVGSYLIVVSMLGNTSNMYLLQQPIFSALRKERKMFFKGSSGSYGWIPEAEAVQE
jgi:hypothetical protein